MHFVIRGTNYQLKSELKEMPFETAYAYTRLKKTVHLQKNVKLIIFKQFLYLKYE